LLTEKQLRGDEHTSTYHLEAAIRESIDMANDHPNPFAWAKTAGAILASVEGFCPRISDSGD